MLMTIIYDRGHNVTLMPAIMTMSNLEGPRNDHTIQGRSWSLQQLNLEHNNDDFNPDDKNDFNPDHSDDFNNAEDDNRDQKVSSIVPQQCSGQPRRRGAGSTSSLEQIQVDNDLYFFPSVNLYFLETWICISM